MQDWIKCIEKKDRESHCGRQADSMEWMFTGATHAGFAIKTESRLTPCSACLNAINTVTSSKSEINCSRSLVNWKLGLK